MSDRSGPSLEERALDELLQGGHLAGAHDLPTLLEEHARVLGASNLVTYVVDLQQNALVPFLPPGGPPGDDHIEQGRWTPRWPAGSTSRGSADPPAGTGADDARFRVWLPLSNGTERLGVLALTVADAEDLERDDGGLALRLRLFGVVAPSW